MPTRSAAVGTMVLLSCTAMAQAQEAPVDEVIVTAQRRSEPLSRMAAPVSAVTGEQLRDANVTKIADLERFFPELTAQPTATGNLLFVRGVGNFTLQPNSDPAVGFTYDGVMSARPGATLGELFDIERVELLKGPQGVLYGRNAAAGALNVLPREPVLGLREALGQATLDDWGQRRVEAALNEPLGTGAAMRISGVLARTGPYLSGYADGERQQGVRAQVKLEPDSRVTLRLGADYSHLGGVGSGSSYVGRYRYSAAEGRYLFESARLPLAQGLYTPSAQAFRQRIFLPGAGRNLDSLASMPFQDNAVAGVHLHTEADLGFAKLTVLPAWRRVSLHLVNAGAPFGYSIAEHDDQKSLDARLSGRRGALDWIAGALIFQESIQSDSATNLSSSLILSDQHYRTRSSAVFGNAKWHLRPGITLSGGLRWTRDDKRFSGKSDMLTILCTARVAGVPACPLAPLFPLVNSFVDQPLAVPAPGGRPLPIFADGRYTGAVVARSMSAGAGRFSKDQLDWRLAAEMQAAAHTLVYATVETGHRPGGFNIATGFETFGPERLTAFNLGLRHRRARFQLDAEAFWWRYRDQQVSALRPDLSSPARNANITSNIGNSRIRGVEVDGRAEPWARGQLRGVVQYLDARYLSFQYLQANTNVPPLTGCAARLHEAADLYTVDCSEKQPYNSPRWSLLLSARQGFALGRFVATAEVASTYRSSRNLGFAMLPEQHVGPTWSTDLRVALAPLEGGWRVWTFIDNLEGRRTPEFMIYHPISNALIAGTSPPRRLGLALSVGR
jgi:iron complex outermembrane receptor protein